MNNKKVFEIRYNDGVFAESISFPINFTNEMIEEYLLKEIKNYNKNINSNYHITRNNIKEVL